MAINKDININIKNNADKTTQDFKEYNKELGNTKKAYDAVLKSGKPFDQQLKDIDKIVKETPLNVRDMNKQIQAYQSIALSAGRETPVGKEALEKAAQLRDKYIDIQNETKRLADDQRNLEGAMQGVATGVAVYGGIQSAMALSGVESEKLRATMVKLQAAQTLMNSVNQVATALEKESALMLTLKAAKTKALTVSTAAYAAVTGGATGAMKLFKVALASTGIGAIIVAVGMLIANFDKVKSAIMGVTDALGITNSAEEKRAANRKRRNKEALAQINAQKSAVRALSNARQKAYDREITLLKAAGKETRDIERQKLKETINRINQQMALEEKAAKHRTGIAGAVQIVNKEAYKNSLDEAKFALEVFDTETQKIDADNLKTKQANYKQYAQERKAQARLIQDIEISLMDEGIDKELEKEKVRFERLKKDVKGTAEEKKRLRELYTDQEEQAVEKIREKYRKKDEAREKARLKKDEAREKARLKNIEDQNNAFLDKIAEIEEMNYQRTLSDEERELRAVQDKYFALEEAAKDNADALTEIQIARLNEENEIRLQYQNEADEAQKVIDDKAKADAQSLADYRIQVAQSSLSAINDLAELFSKGNEKQAKRAFNIQKAVGIAQATINTAQAITKVFAETTDFTPTQSLRIANAVAIGVAGAAQIASIASQQFQGGGGDGVQTPSETGTGAVSPEFNVVGDAATNQLAQIQQQPTQAFVVSGEVTSAQALDRNRVQNATL